jgi:hypothetical protein
MIYVCAFIAWFLISVPLGMLAGGFAADDPGITKSISKLKSKARLILAGAVRAALSIVQSPSTGGR